MKVFPRTEVGVELQRRMQKKGLVRLEEELKQAILQEACDLQKTIHRARLQRVEDFLNDAEDYYCNEILEFIGTPEYQLTPDDILNQRRKSTAWAIAVLLFKAETEVKPR